MPVKEPAKKASFLVVCRSNYFNDIRPADPQSGSTKGYAEAVALARSYFADNQMEAFRAYLAEGKYLADLWAAHLVLEYGQPEPALKKECLAVIERHAASPFDKELAQQELQWLKAHGEAERDG